MKSIAYAMSLILFVSLVAAAQAGTRAGVSSHYITGQEALAADNYAKAKTAFAALAKESTGDLQAKAQATANAPNIAAMRDAFKPLSEVVIKMSLPSDYAVAYCPMYKGGASWVQKKGTINNPYFGKTMLTCGEFKTK